MTSAGEAAERGGERLKNMSPHSQGSTAVAPGPTRLPVTTAEGAVTALYQAHALGMIRLAHIMLGDRASAEDVVQEAFYGLYRRWSALADTGNAIAYVRSSVLNGCRSVLRRQSRTRDRADVQQAAPPPEISAEAAAITLEERQEVLRALRRLPARQREALVLRFYLDLSAEESAATMGIGPGSVRSAIHRGLASLGRMLQEQS
jgi:RNA polymerase sigma-70 factor (sigma-E family)